MQCKLLWIKASAKCINVNVINPRIEFLNEAIKHYIKCISSARIDCTCVAFVLRKFLFLWLRCRKGFPKIVDWLEAQQSFEVTSWALGKGWCGVSGLVEVLRRAHLELDTEKQLCSKI